MDEIALFNVSLSQTDIKSLMAKSLGITLSVSSVNKLVAT